MKYFLISTTGYTLDQGIYETSDNKFMLKSLILDNVKVSFTVDDLRLRSILTLNKTIKFT